MNEAIQDINKRLVRMETKITRMLTGEGDRGVTAFDYELDFVDNVWCLRVRSGGVSLKQVAQVLSTEGVENGEDVHVYVSGAYVISVCVE